MTTTTDEVYRVCCDTVDGDRVLDATLVPDDCGALTWVLVTFADGYELVVGPEAEGGYTFSAYCGMEYDEQPYAERFVTTDGDSDLGSLVERIRFWSRPTLNI